MEYVMEYFEEQTGRPFYSIYRRAQLASSAAEITKSRLLRRLSTDPRFKDVLKDEIALQRVSDEINSKNPATNVQSPQGLTNNELNLANEIESIYDYFKPHVRFMRIENTKLTIEAFKKEFPDAVDAGKVQELQMAMRLMDYGDRTNNYNPLWQFVQIVDWGVIQSGYDPLLISFPSLKVKRRSMDTARGEGRVMARESISFKHTDKNVVQRLLTYMEQINIQWAIAPEINYLGEIWEQVGAKFKDESKLRKELELWSATVQGIPPDLGDATRLALRIRRTAMSAFFANPMLALRNAPQGLVMGLDRSELFRIIVDPIRPDLNQTARLYYDEAVSEIGGLNTDFLLQDEQAYKGVRTATRVADFISLFGKSEYYPRLWTFMAQVNKADRAMDTLLTDSNDMPVTKEQVAKYLNDSGANHLRDSERNYLLAHFISQLGYKYDLGIEGLREVSGADMASLYIAQRAADIVHFKYNQAQKAPMEMGVGGRVLWNLMVFPRSVAQRLYFDIGRIFDPMREKLLKTFNKDTDLDTEGTGGSVKAAWKDILTWTGAAMVFGWLLTRLTGKENDSYGILNILSGWSFGGVFVGVNTDFFDWMNSTAIIANPNTTDEKRKAELSGYPTLVKRLVGMYPLYTQVSDILDTVLGTTNADKQLLRNLIQGKNILSPDEYKKEERTLFEVFKKVFLSIDTPVPNKYEQTRKSIQDSLDSLGQRDKSGNITSLTDLGNTIASSSKDMPIDSLDTIFPKPSLPVFYKECEPVFKTYLSVPTEKSKQRMDWRKAHVEAEAMLQFWGKVSTSAFPIGSKEDLQVKKLKSTWRQMYGVTDSSMPKADYTNLPPEK
jgi:hypothetical protein